MWKCVYLLGLKSQVQSWLFCSRICMWLIVNVSDNLSIKGDIHSIRCTHLENRFMFIFLIKHVIGLFLDIMSGSYIYIYTYLCNVNNLKWKINHSYDARMHLCNVYWLHTTNSVIYFKVKDAIIQALLMHCIAYTDGITYPKVITYYFKMP